MQECTTHICTHLESPSNVTYCHKVPQSIKMSLQTRALWALTLSLSPAASSTIAVNRNLANSDRGNQGQQELLHGLRIWEIRLKWRERADHKKKFYWSFEYFSECLANRLKYCTVSTVCRPHRNSKSFYLENDIFSFQITEVWKAKMQLGKEWHPVHQITWDLIKFQ